jgi:release factor glutamine methyltransferase
VEQALAWLREHPDKRRGADVGTGSGCIAVSLACHVPDLHILATDIYPAALDVATRNAQKHGVSNRIDFVNCDLLPDGFNREDAKGAKKTFIKKPSRSSSLRGSFPSRSSSVDLLTANLPYIPTPTLQSLPVHGREPALALDGGADGLDAIRRLVAMLPDVMAPGGLCLLEIESTQGQAMLALAEESMPAVNVTLHQDLARMDRLIRIEY